MDIIERTALWRRTLGEQSGRSRDSASRNRAQLRETFIAFRERACVLSRDIPRDLSALTVHDDSGHSDALWQIAGDIVGEDYAINPAEAFVLGATFVLHDLGLALAAYPGGLTDLKKTQAWSSAVASAIRNHFGRAPRAGEIENPPADILKEAKEGALLNLHAERAPSLAMMPFQHREHDEQYYLIENTDIRRTYGDVIGAISASHWWPIGRLRERFGVQQGAFPGWPAEWTIDPLKLACVLRAADACHLDARRAPGFLRAIRKPSGSSEKHWRFQEYVQTPYVQNNQIFFTSARAFPTQDIDAWWQGFELVTRADGELHDVDALLRDLDRPPFDARSVAGASDPKALTKYLPCDGWIPVDTTVRATNVASLVSTLGGYGLYGRNPTVPLRELIQNARDAVVARRVLERRDAKWGTITVRVGTEGGGDWIEVEDSGIGMSEQLLTGAFLDFGSTYWGSRLMEAEWPGLTSSEFEWCGKYGIGFFSVFMWGSRVRVTTRRAQDLPADTHVLEFEDGLTRRPVMRAAHESERRMDPGTAVRVWLRRRVYEDGGLAGPGNHDDPDLRGTRRRKPWVLADLCAWLCPALDVDLLVDENGSRTYAVRASDWITIEPRQLLRRTLLAREDCDAIVSQEILGIVAENLRVLADSDGKVIGRACISRSSGYDWAEESSVVTAGPFRSRSIMFTPGVLIGKATGATRDSAQPLAPEHRDQLADWATEQARLVWGIQQAVERQRCVRAVELANNTARPGDPGHDLLKSQADLMTRLGRGIKETMETDPVGVMTYSNAMTELAQIAALIRVMGGDTGPLPIARMHRGFVSFEEICDCSDLPDEMVLFADLFWDSRFRSSKAQSLLPNAVGVPFGRMRSLWFGCGNKEDIQDRANHPAWRRFWMSLTGAVIEAIARSWGVPLQKVLEASEFSTSENILESPVAGTERERILLKEVDIIRRPCAPS